MKFEKLKEVIFKKYGKLLFIDSLNSLHKILHINVLNAMMPNIIFRE